MGKLGGGTTICRLAGIIGRTAAAEPFVERMRLVSLVNPHGNGIGGFVDGVPLLRRTASSAIDEPGFALHGFGDTATAIMHDRFATVGIPDARNSHPFLIGDRGERPILFAQNGTIDDSDTIVQRWSDLLDGYELPSETDTLRYGTVLHALRERADGDVVRAWRELLADLSANHEMTSANAMMTDASGDLWAVRYPENRTLYVRRLGVRDAADGQRLLGPDGMPANADAVDGALTVVASQPLDESGAWQLLPPGRLLHVRAGDLRETMTDVIDAAPRRRIDAEVDLGTTWRWPEPARWRRSPFPHDPDGLREAIARTGGVPTSAQVAAGTAPTPAELVDAAHRQAAATPVAAAAG